MPTRSVKERLKTAMQSRNITVTSLSLEMGLSKASISDWLKTEKIAIEHLSQFSLLLNISLDWLLLGKGEMDLHGPVHLSESEREMITQLHQQGGQTALACLYEFLKHLLHQQFSLSPVQQILDYHMLEEIGCALCVLDANGLVCDANDNCLSMLGLATEEKHTFVSSNITYWIHKNYLLQAIEHSKLAMHNNELSSMHCEILYQKNPKHAIPVTIIAKPRLYHGEKLIDCIILQESTPHDT